MKIVPLQLIMAGLSVAVQGWTMSHHRVFVHLHLVLFVVMDEKSHDYHDFIVIVGIIRRCVDDIVEEKPTLTICHGL
jgi:hypothetical protein